MAVAYQSTQTTSGASSPLVCNKPVSTVVGDLLIAHFALSGVNGRTLTPPAGWTLVGSESRSNTSGPQSALYYRLTDGTEGSTFSFAYSGGGVNSSLAISRFTGANLATQIGASNGNANGASTTATTTGITPDANSMICLFVSSNLSSDSVYSAWSITTSDPGLVERYDTNCGTGVSLGMASAVRAQATATGATSATISSPSLWVSHILSIAPGADVSTSAPLYTPLALLLVFPFNAQLLNAAATLLAPIFHSVRNQTRHTNAWRNATKNDSL